MYWCYAIDEKFYKMLSGYSGLCSWLSSPKVVSTILRAVSMVVFTWEYTSTKLMNLLSGLVVWSRVEWLLRPMSMVPGVRALVNGHPGTKESEELRVTIASSAAIAIWALAWSIMFRGLVPAWQADVEDVRWTGQARVGGKMLLKDLVSFFSFSLSL